jgi:SAM-dependent methyltransferase
MKEHQWLKYWRTGEYLALKKRNFRIIDQFLAVKPSNLLDIGAGTAYESRQFNKLYGTELYLLDGQFSEAQKRYTQFGSAESFGFYSDLDDLKQFYISEGCTNFKIINCANINIDSNLKFDLIYSFLSCGFHYPVETYRELILNHSHNDTVVILDIRKGQEHHSVNIVNILNRSKKYLTCEVKLV